jgi:hypothetical protein
LEKFRIKPPNPRFDGRPRLEGSAQIYMSALYLFGARRAIRAILKVKLLSGVFVTVISALS